MAEAVAARASNLGHALALIFDRDKENKPLPRASMTTRWSDESASASYSNFQGIYRGVAVSAAERARATSG